MDGARTTPRPADDVGLSSVRGVGAVRGLRALGFTGVQLSHASIEEGLAIGVALAVAALMAFAFLT